MISVLVVDDQQLLRRGLRLLLESVADGRGDEGEVIVVGEAADVLFHLMVLLDARSVKLADVLAELARREGTSGLEEKASRSG